MLYKLTPERRLTPFVVGGAGLINNLGDDTVITLVGSYVFTVTGTYSERDNVTVRYGVASHDFVGVVGGGFTYALNPKSGIRVDVRWLIGRNSAQTLVSTLPAIATSPSGAFVLAPTTNPSVQFSNNPTTYQSSLNSAGLVTECQTFDGSGMASTINVSAGWYVASEPAQCSSDSGERGLRIEGICEENNRDVPRWPCRGGGSKVA